MSDGDRTEDFATSAGMSPADFPELQRDASKVSAAGQYWYLWLARVELTGMISASAFGAWSFVSPEGWRKPIELATVFSLLTALLANLIGRMRQDDRAWFEGRAISESIKTSVWRFVMRIAPYDDDATCNRIFAKQMLAVLISAPHLRHELADTSTDSHQITGRMRELRALPLPKRAEWYREHRLLQQVTWYRRKAAENRAAGNRWFWASIGAQLSALGAAVIGVANHHHFDIVAVLATVAVAFTAWANLRQHDELSQAYGVASQELLAISDLLVDSDTEASFTAIVQEAEAAISREHTMWFVKRSKLTAIAPHEFPP